MLAALLLAALLHRSGPFPTPALTRVEPGRDTVWLTAPATDWSPPVSYAYVRATRSWLRVGGVERARAVSTLPANVGDSVDIAPGFVLVRRPSPPHREGGRFVLVSTRDRREFPVAPDTAPRSARAAVLAAAGDEWARHRRDTLPRISDELTAWARDDGGIWLGFNGGVYAALEGDFGVLLRFDVASRTFRMVTTPELADARVSSLAVAGGRLWVGTQYSEFLGGFVGRRGLLVRDLASGAWQTLGVRERALPGDLVHAVVPDGDGLWVTTDGGITRLDVRTRLADTRWFSTAMRGDSIVHELVESEPPARRAGETILTLADLLGVPRRAFWDAASALPPSRFDIYISVDEEEWDVTGAPAALAHPTLLPFLREALGRGGPGRDVVVEAMGMLGAADVLPLLRAAFDSSRGSQRIATAVALGRLGDSTGFHYLRSRLADTVSDGEDDPTIGAVIQGAAALNDRESLALLRPWLKTKTGGPVALNALADRADLAGWRRLARDARENRMVWEPFLVRLSRCDSGCRDPVDDPEVRAVASDVARRAMVDPGYREQWAPAAVALRYGDAAAIPYLIGALTMDRPHYEVAVRALIRMTGVDSVPVPLAASAADRLRAQRFFADWWAAHRQGFRPAPREVGEAALLRWFDRSRRR